MQLSPVDKKVLQADVEHCLRLVLIDFKGHRLTENVMAVIQHKVQHYVNAVSKTEEQQ